MFNMTMHYPQWNYITVPSFMFRCVIVSELKRKKEEEEEEEEEEDKNSQNRLLLI